MWSWKGLEMFDLFSFLAHLDTLNGTELCWSGLVWGGRLRGRGPVLGFCGRQRVWDAWRMNMVCWFKWSWQLIVCTKLGFVTFKTKPRNSKSRYFPPPISHQSIITSSFVSHAVVIVILKQFFFFLFFTHSGYCGWLYR